MSKVRELEVVEPEEGTVVETNSTSLAKVVATSLAEMLASAPSNAAEMVEAVEVDCTPVAVYKTSVRLVLK
ncbi:MAG: hypothetical protein CL942_11130 [Desulfovibrio sp.]|nr:hypothetical protein [Desulfovibrio sp.]|tara:strand:+ start:21931 stop:22143 length:213 start_codon:yes stop_codon:yes gene_type:complete